MFNKIIYSILKLEICNSSRTIIIEFQIMLEVKEGRWPGLGSRRILLRWLPLWLINGSRAERGQNDAFLPRRFPKNKNKMKWFICAFILRFLSFFLSLYETKTTKQWNILRTLGSAFLDHKQHQSNSACLHIFARETSSPFSSSSL